MQKITCRYHLICHTALLLMLFSISGCQKNPPSNNGAPAPFRFIPARDSTLVVWVKPGAAPNAFVNWKANLEARFGRVDIRKRCSECDNNLMLLSGPAIQIFISGETATGGNGSMGRTGSSGEDGDILFSVNYPIEHIDDIRQNDTIGATGYVFKKPTLNAITVGIFDTGVDDDPKLSGLFYQNPMPSCLGAGSNNGWNFAASTPDYRDNNPSKHGTVVAAFVADQVYKYGKNSVSILPIKAHDAEGKSDLFSILCGMSYAVNRGVSIINASFGFYTPRYLAPSRVADSSAYLFRKYIEYYLLSRNILLIAAAGNRDDRNEDIVYNPADRSLQRNLENVSFYPASFARDMRNVFAVTTVNRAPAVSPSQNYSPTVVDVGVYADRNSDFAFENPIRPQRPVIGSSFATPIVTGKLCAYYYLIEGMVRSGSYTKTAILNALGTAGIIEIAPALDDKIRNKIVMSK